MSFIETPYLIESGGLLFGLIYIFCAHTKSNYSWFFGILSAICIIIVDIHQTHLYFDAILHGFFLIMSGIGVYLWYKGADTNKEIRISRMSPTMYIGYVVISVLIAGAAGFLFDVQTDAAYPYLDAFQMMLSIFATFLIIYCVLNAWSYWLVVDLVSISLYVATGAYLLSILYVAYLISNIIKWKQWSKMYRLRKKQRRA